MIFPSLNSKNVNAFPLRPSMNIKKSDRFKNLETIIDQIQFDDRFKNYNHQDMKVIVNSKKTSQTPKHFPVGFSDQILTRFISDEPSSLKDLLQNRRVPQNSPKSSKNSIEVDSISNDGT